MALYLMVREMQYFQKTILIQIPNLIRISTAEVYKWPINDLIKTQKDKALEKQLRMNSTTKQKKN